MMTKNSMTTENKTCQIMLMPSLPCSARQLSLHLEDFFFPTSGLFASASTATAPLQTQHPAAGTNGTVSPHLNRLFSGAIAGIVSRTAVAPLETIRTHLMVGSNGNSAGEVFDSIVKSEGWKGLFRGNFVNVIRVAPSKAVELFTFDTVYEVLSSKEDEPPKLPVPSSLVAGAMAGVTPTLCTYPLELIKTRLTIQREAYTDFFHCFVKIVEEEGPHELFRGLWPSVIGVIPYCSINYYAYDTFKKLHRKTFKTKDVSSMASLLIGAAAAAISSTATFPLEVARKHIQAGAVGGREVYKNIVHALLGILKDEGVAGLYKGLGPSNMKLVPAAGISFMCYELCKKIMIEEEVTKASQ